MKTLEISELKNNVFGGEGSYGNKYEVAVKDGQLFTRDYCYNGYGMNWTKWQPLNKMCGYFYIEPATEFYPERERLKWGWGIDAIGYTAKVKLPKS